MSKESKIDYDFSKLYLPGFWLLLILTSYPQNWEDHVFVGIFLAVVFGPPLLLLLFFLAVKTSSEGQENVPAGTEPKSGIYEINCSDNGWTVLFGLLVGGVTAWLAPMLLGQPHMPDWARAPYIGWGLGVLVFLLILGIDYQDVIQLNGPKRMKRFRYYGVSLFDRSEIINAPYQIYWGWYSYRVRRGQYGHRTIHRLGLHNRQIDGIEILSFGEDHLPSLEELNEIGERYASWNDGRVFAYSPLNDYPRKS